MRNAECLNDELKPVLNSTLRAPSRVRVQPRQKVADAEVREDDEEERDDCEVGRRASRPAARDSDVQERAVGEPRDERADLLRVPSPVAPPRLVGPHRARDEKQREPREGQARGLIHQRVYLLDRGQRRAQALRPDAEDDDEERADEGRDERRKLYGVRLQTEEEVRAVLLNEG